MGFEIIKIRDHVLHIQDPLGGVYVTLIIGSEKAVLFDTGMGGGPLRQFVENLISVPYIVINSHGHTDHAGGNFQFDEVWIDKADVSLLTSNLNIAFSKSLIKDMKNVEGGGLPEKVILAAKYDNYKVIDFSEIDLGNIHIKIIKTPGHTGGSISLLLQEDRLLLVGDAVNDFLWMFFKEALKIQDEVNSLIKLLFEEFDTYLGSHFTKEMPKDRVVFLAKMLKNITIENSTVPNVPFLKKDAGVYMYKESYNGIDSCVFFTKDKL